jgi:hypothetical protein
MEPCGFGILRLRQRSLSASRFLKASFLSPIPTADTAAKPYGILMGAPLLLPHGLMVKLFPVSPVVSLLILMGAYRNQSYFPRYVGEERLIYIGRRSFLCMSTFASTPRGTKKTACRIFPLWLGHQMETIWPLREKTCVSSYGTFPQRHR